MDIVRGSDIQIRNQVMEPDFEYDFHRYLIEADNLIYNAITGEIIRDVDLEKDKDALIRKWYMLPSDLDPKSLLYYIRQNRLNLVHDLPVNRYTIFTTMKCNACCSYCFQHGGSEATMSIDTANEVTEYILRHCDRSKRVVLKWFGGEPLVNKDVITTICKNLRVRGISYSSDMSSNGDLFETVNDGEIYLWNLRTVQLTIDRPGSGYDEDKGLPLGAYDRLLKTIERFENLGVFVQVRIHYHPGYGLEVSKEIVDNLKDFQNVSMYSALLYDDDTKREDYEAISKLDEYMLRAGVLRTGFDSASANSYCMADSDRTRCIRADGSLTPCEHYSEGETLGTIYDDLIDEDLSLKWRSKRKHELGCTDCPLYPSCEILTNCPSIGKCEDGYKEYRVERIRRILRNLGGLDE